MREFERGLITLLCSVGGAVSSGLQRQRHWLRRTCRVRGAQVKTRCGGELAKNSAAA